MVTEDFIETFVVFVIFILPLLGALYELTKMFLGQLNEIKLAKSQKRHDLSPILKMTFIIAGMLYGIFLLAFLSMAFVGPSDFELPFWIWIVFIVAFGPYLACIYGIAYGLGPAVGTSGIHSRRMFSTVFGKNKKKK